eukprot:TRINITY_DN1799_c0_g4_i4.p1 TRINITY_DN1799_c0_g4~~TRINITY_DN1799_c0_g4_i4.p1  ORF type:complete len:162 (+),score=55.98 TRINITY_DN1799_c0_g4_i4:166-651(+)
MRIPVSHASNSSTGSPTPSPLTSTVKRSSTSSAQMAAITRHQSQRISRSSIDMSDMDSEERSIGPYMNSGKGPYSDLWFEMDPELRVLQESYSKDFFEIFAEGMQAYLDGDWGTAVKNLEETLEMNEKEDGPSKTILDFIRSHPDCEAPVDWPGYRCLLEK